ncbi:MAG: hypothetical protein ACTSQE_07050 [Candidatus Heimdallarchaeaceae archaeon]
MFKQTVFERCEPAVPKFMHYLLAGVMWLGVGIMLSNYAVQWLVMAENEPVWIYSISGMIAALVIYLFGFSKIAKKNVERILPKNDKFCVFGFISWKSYLTIGFMISLGILLRMSPIPKHYLAVLYSGLGGGLGLSSFVYFGELVKHFRDDEIPVEEEIKTLE